jgi:hypothetical protein
MDQSAEARMSVHQKIDRFKQWDETPHTVFLQHHERSFAG